MTAIDKLIQTAENEVGYLEKRNNNDLYEMTANAGSGNYTKYWAEIMPSYQGEPWCACFVTWCFVKAFGRDMAERLLRHYPYVYCPTMASLFTLHANPQRGDIVIFYHSGEFTHTGIVTNTDGDYFTTIEGNTSGGSTIIANGGAVCNKGYYNSNLPGTKFCRPDYGIIEESEDLDMEKLNELEKRIEKLESERDTMIYNYIDKNMPDWAHEAVKWCADNGIVNGTGDGLGLSNIKLWVCVVMYRLARYMAKA